jgi:hypothetical protein
VITLTGTSRNRDGEWLRVSLHGSWVADVRRPADLAEFFPLHALRIEVNTRPKPVAPVLELSVIIEYKIE